MYDDEYPTCRKTHATFRLYPGSIDPLVVTEQLGIEPTEWQRQGEPIMARPGRPPRIAPLSGWFLRSREQVDSKDSRRHLDWLLDQVGPKVGVIRALQEAGCRMDIFCYWLSQSGHGGPIVSPAQMGRLAALNIELGFDIYGPYEDD